MVKTTFLLSAGVLLSFLPSVEATRNRWVNMPDDHTGWAQISDGDCCFTHDRFGTAVKDRCPYYGYWGGWDDGYYGYGRGDAWWIVDGKYARARKPAGDKDKLEMCTGGELRQGRSIRCRRYVHGRVLMSSLCPRRVSGDLSQSFDVVAMSTTVIRLELLLHVDV